MSSPAQAGPSAPKEKRNVSTRVLTRMKTIMKKAEKRMSFSGPSKGAPGEPSSSAPTTNPAPTEAKSAAPAVAVEAAAPVPEPAPAPTSAPAETMIGTSGSAGKARVANFAGGPITKVPRMQLHEERARRLGERFGLEIKPSEWYSTEGDALRVNKPIRMRVHRKCHVCDADFGGVKECPSCKHMRCKKCIRYPPKRTEEEKAASRERRAAVLKEQKENPPIIADWDMPKKKIVLTRPAKVQTQDLVYKKPRQRLRRTCCQCEKLFQGGNKICLGCSHARCTDCPRDPAKKNKYPYGYPGDEFGAKSIPVYACHQCKSKFPTDATDGVECAICKHPKCSECARLKPQRIEPEPDPEILKAIEARLSQLRVG